MLYTTPVRICRNLHVKEVVIWAKNSCTPFDIHKAYIDFSTCKRTPGYYNPIEAPKWWRRGSTFKNNGQRQRGRGNLKEKLRLPIQLKIEKILVEQEGLHSKFEQNLGQTPINPSKKGVREDRNPWCHKCGGGYSNHSKVIHKMWYWHRWHLQMNTSKPQP